MAVNFCTMPTQHGTTGILFPKLTAQLKFPKIQIIYICIYIYRFIYLYKKTNSSMLCINSSNSFSKFCSHLNKIIETSSTLHLKKKKVKKQNLRKQQSSVTVVVPGTIFFFNYISQSSSGKKTF